MEAAIMRFALFIKLVYFADDVVHSGYGHCY